MILAQKQALNQTLALSPAMRQSLHCLQLSAPELDAYAREAALSNPLLRVQSPRWYEPVPASLTRRPDFREHLEAQIGQMKGVDGELLPLCRYLIGCLNDRGYLDCPVEELAREVGCTPFQLTQALYAVQMLDPPGVGARSLCECLTLQLTQGKAFAALPLAIAREGLEYLGRRDYAGLAAHLGVSEAAARQAAEEILALSPIPTRGFSGAEPAVYVAPDAEARVEQGKLVLELNRSILPRVSVQPEYARLLTDSDDPEVRRYVREQLAQAQALIRAVRTRGETLGRLLTLIGQTQEDFFLHGGALAPITMRQAAERLGVSVSTVSRAAQNKFLRFQGRTLPLRGFFCAAIRSDAAVSGDMVRRRIRLLIDREPPQAPLSDEALCLALRELNLSVTRRTVAKYRAAMGIPPSTQRGNKK